MKLRNALLTIAPLALLIAACHNSQSIDGDGTVITQSRSLTGFNQIEAVGAYQINVVNGKKIAFKITGEDNILPAIITEVSNNTLHIHVNSQVNINPTHTVVINMTIPKLDTLSSSGSNTIAIDILSGKNLNIQTSGTSQTRIRKVSGENLTVKLSGDSNLALTGQIQNLNVMSSGSTQILAKNLISQSAQVDLSGNSILELAAQKNLYIKASGNSKITYFGNPDDVIQTLSGSSTVIHVPLLMKKNTPKKAPITPITTATASS